MEMVRFTVPTSKPFVIAPLGDIQYNGDLSEIWTDGLRRHIDRAMKANAYFVGMGDLIDFASPSSRHKLLSSGAYDNTMRKLDDIATILENEVYDRFLKVTRGRWVGLHEGHHFWVHKDGTTTDTRLALRLGCPHLGTEAIVEWHWGAQTFQTWSHHGWGGGEEPALLGRLKKTASDWIGVRAFFMGHATKMAHTIVPQLQATFAEDGTGDLGERRVHLVGTGGWSKGKVAGSRDGQVPRGGYVERGGLRPVSLGAPLIYVSVNERGELDMEVRTR